MSTLSRGLPAAPEPMPAHADHARFGFSRYTPGNRNDLARDPTSGGMTTAPIRESLESYLCDLAYQVDVGERKPATLVHCRKWAQEIDQLADLDPADLTPRRVKAWRNALAEAARLRSKSRDMGGDGTATANGALSLLRRVLRHGEVEGLLPMGIERSARIVPRYRDKIRERYLTGDEVRRLWAATHQIEEYRKRRRLDTRPIDGVRLLLLTGMRHAEVVSLLWADVVLGDALIRLHDSKSGRREVALSCAAVDLPERPGSAGHLRSLQKYFRRVLDCAGIDPAGVMPHTAGRHTEATLALRSGHDIRAIADTLGHTDDRVTRAVYAKRVTTPAARAVAESHARILQGRAA